MPILRIVFLMLATVGMVNTSVYFNNITIYMRTVCHIKKFPMIDLTVNHGELQREWKHL